MTRAGPLARRVAFFSVVVTLIALVLVRDPRADGAAALAALAAGLATALVAILLAGFAFVRVWREGARGLGAALGGLFIALPRARLSGLCGAQGFSPARHRGRDHRHG